MPARRKEGGECVIGIAGSVMPDVRARLCRAAKGREMTLAAYIGEVLSEHAKQLPGVEVDERQGNLWEEKRLARNLGEK